jgi:hypothetical protein
MKRMIHERIISMGHETSQCLFLWSVRQDGNVQARVLVEQNPYSKNMTINSIPGMLIA